MKVGVIGLGSIGSRHVKNLQGMGQEVIGFDPFIRIEGVPACLTVEDLIAYSDAIVIASPTIHHHNQLVDVVKSGKPFFVEKPVADTMAVCHLKVPKAMVGYNLRFHHCVIAARHWINTAIGKPLWAQFMCAQVNTKLSYLRDGVTLNWSHEIDLALHLLGPAEVKGSVVRLAEVMGGEETSDDMADILLRHQNGCHTAIHLDYLTDPEKRYFTVYGERGSLLMSIAASRPAGGFLLDRGDKMLQRFDDPRPFDDCYVDEMKDFISFAQGGPSQAATWEDGLRAMIVCLKVREEYR